MNVCIEKTYAQRPKRWVFLAFRRAVIVTALIVWSATAGKPAVQRRTAAKSL